MKIRNPNMGSCHLEGVDFRAMMAIPGKGPSFRFGTHKDGTSPRASQPAGQPARQNIWGHAEAGRPPGQPAGHIENHQKLARRSLFKSSR